MFLVMAIPMWLVFGLKMSLSQKLGLCAVLGLGVIIIVFSVVRIIVTNTIGRQPEITWLALWSSIESSVAVIVACLASFKVLFSANRGSSYPGGYGASGGGYRGNASSGRKDAGQRGSRYGSRYASNKSSATRVGHRELTSGSFDDAEMQNLGTKNGHGNITITGGRDRDPRSRRYGEKEWDDDAESQQHIMNGDDIRVQTTWNVEPDVNLHSPSPHAR